ncbi:unnamed protein product [Amoebophrya sp. A120]|nr:unnamed protein product [Amoebophrya sp. A120]|eukprot:GSA120T00015501001.1
MTTHFKENVVALSKTEQECAGANDDQYQVQGSVKIFLPGASVSTCGSAESFILLALEKPVKEAFKAHFSLTKTSFDVYIEDKPNYGAKCSAESSGMSYEFGFILRSLSAGKAKCVKTALAGDLSALFTTLQSKCNEFPDSQVGACATTLSGGVSDLKLGSEFTLEYRPPMYSVQKCVGAMRPLSPLTQTAPAGREREEQQLRRRPRLPPQPRLSP